MSERAALIREAFAAFEAGRLDGVADLFAADARWIGIPQGRDLSLAGCCDGRERIVERFALLSERRRRFALGEVIEHGDRVALEVTVSDPSWSDSVSTYKVFTFAAGADQVVRLNDCLDESYALQVLAA